jgi:hypothetical protein
MSVTANNAAATNVAIISAAVRLAGTKVEIDSEQFLKIATKLQENGALIIHGKTGLRQKSDLYLVGNQGIILYCKETIHSSIKIDIEAKYISMI